MISNVAQVRAMIEAMIIGGMAHEKVFLELRNDNTVRDILGNLSNQEFRGQVDAVAGEFAKAYAEAKRRGPLLAAHLELQHRAGALAAELSHQLAQLELEDPQDVRDAADLMMSLERIQSVAQGKDLIKKVIEYLQTAERDVKALEHEYLDLFPERVTTKGE